MNIKKIYKIRYLFLFLVTFIRVFSQEMTLEELLKLKNQGVISEEDFKILKSELQNEIYENEGLYSVNINGTLVSRTYGVLFEKGRTFFPIKEFFKYIGFTNFNEKDGVLTAYLGSSLREERIDLKSRNVIEKNGEIYLVSEEFSEKFLKDYTIDKSNQRIRMNLGFDTPNEIKQLLNITEEKMKLGTQEKDLVFKSQRQMFDLGYTRVQLGQNFNKNEGSKNYDSDWDGTLSYQGGLFYGEVKADFDMREKELNTVRLEYVDIWEAHNLDIENRRVGAKREWGLSIYKDKGYYETSGGQVIIRESVPIGSRVELIYMGTTIAIQDDENGVVEFDNPMIRTDRTYVLKIYQPDGRIDEKTIKTVEDYNLQRRREFQYGLNINENSEYGKFYGDAEVFYGITNNLTLGVGYIRGIEELDLGLNSLGNRNLRTEYVDSTKLNLVYGNNYNGLSYVVSLTGAQTLNNKRVYNRGTDESGIDLKKRYEYGMLTQLNYDKWKLIYEHNELGKYHDMKNNDKLQLTYNVLENLEFGYNYEILRYYNSKDEKLEQFTASLDHSWNGILFGIGGNFDINDSKKNQYSTSIYYGGWQTVNARLENIWTENGDVYETKLGVYNNNYNGVFDFSTELAYSNKDKERVTFKVSMKLDNWLTFDNNFTSRGARNHRIGIDKIIDLKKPSQNLDTMDNSRVKVITFIDSNNNDVYDFGENLVPGVEVKIGNDAVTTDKKGEGYFYGIGNGNIYDLNVTIKKPSFTLGNNKIKVKSEFASTIEAYIPIKPMLTLSGKVNVDQALKLTSSEKEELYNDLIIEIKDFKGETLEIAAPDNTGDFDISGLFPKDYYVAVTYVGVKYDLKSIQEEIVLGYSEDGNDNTLLLRVSNNNMKIDLPKDSNIVSKLN